MIFRGEKAEQLLKKMVMSWDNDDSLEFLQALHISRKFLGLKLSNQIEEKEEQDVLEANKMESE